jgi:hypothetical protein
MAKYRQRTEQPRGLIPRHEMAAKATIGGSPSYDPKPAEPDRSGESVLDSVRRAYAKHSGR